MMSVIIGIILGIVVFAFVAFAVVAVGDYDEEYQEAMKDMSEHDNEFDDYI